MATREDCIQRLEEEIARLPETEWDKPIVPGKKDTPRYLLESLKDPTSLDGDKYFRRYLKVLEEDELARTKP